VLVIDASEHDSRGIDRRRRKWILAIAIAIIGIVLWQSGAGGSHSYALALVGASLAMQILWPRKTLGQLMAADSFPDVESTLNGLDRRFILVRNWIPTFKGERVSDVIFGPSGAVVIAFEGPDGNPGLAAKLPDLVRSVESVIGPRVTGVHVVSDYRHSEAPNRAIPLSALAGYIVGLGGSENGPMLWESAWQHTHTSTTGATML